MIPLSQPSIGPEEIAAVAQVLESGMLASGANVIRFEEAFAGVVGVDHAVAVGSGTAALHVGLVAMGLQPDDEVIVPSFTFAATANSVRIAGGVPVFADIDPRDFTIHAAHVEPLITDRTRAIMPVHLYGQPAPMKEIVELADAHGFDVVEDAAQAHLAESRGQRVGSFGRFGAFSFYPTKNMTTGEGGMITTSDPDLADRARWFRNQGMASRYEHKIVGLNERMTEIEAAIGLVQLGKVEGWTEKRRKIAQSYDHRLDPRLGLPVEREDAFHVYHQYTLAPEDRRPVIEALEETEIGYGVYYPKPTHRQDPYRHLGLHLPITEEMTQRVISIPVRPSLTEAETDLIVSTINRAVR